MPRDEVHTKQEARSECPIVRTHKRFLLRQLEFTQQYALMYRSRMAAQQDRAVAAIKRAVEAEDGDRGGGIPSDVLRVLEMKLGVPAFSVGILYKQMKLLPRFLDEYQRELVRIDAGDDNDEDGDGGLGDESGVGAAEAREGAGQEGDAVVGSGEGAVESGQDRAAADEHYNICHVQDELMLEDSSGRVSLQGLKVTHFCTGVVIGIYGTLMPNGQVLVHRYAFAGLEELYVPRPLVHLAEPCYIAFVCGLNVTLPENAWEGCGCGVGTEGLPPTASPMSHAALVRHRALLELLVDFMSGTTHDASLLEKTRRISRLVIGGNSIAPTDELKLKKKVKLDPSDHVRLNDDKTNTGPVTSAKLMRELDTLLERLAATVEVELMPGDNDMSDAFQPQQPLHPVLLPNAARYSTLRLVSNPFEFTTLVNEGSDTNKNEEEEDEEERKDSKRHSNARQETPRGVNFFVTSGQNVNDVARETRFDTHLDAMGMILASGCACPTAPNTLSSYPFRDEDPFLFHRTPHCFVACDQPCYETRFVSVDALHKRYSTFLESGKQRDEQEEKGEGRSGAKEESVSDGSVVQGVRMVCVPSFVRSGTVVLVNVNSPTLETTHVTFALRGLGEV